jgi:Na+/H+ antiporter NhaA
MNTEDDGKFPSSAHTPRPQGLSWRGSAEVFVISGLTFTITLCIKNFIFKSDSFFVQWGIYASLYTLFKFLYQKLIRSI